MSKTRAISTPQMFGVAFFALVCIYATLQLNSSPAVEAWLVERHDVNNIQGHISEETVKVVCLGDTHSHHRSVKVPTGDVLIFTGDMTDPVSAVSNEDQIKDFLTWLSEQPHKHKIVIAGNHDPEGVGLKKLGELVSPVATYLQDSMATLPVGNVELTVWGTPWQPQYPGTETFVPEHSSELLERWSKIPQGVHVVASHSPPFLHHDRDPQGTHIGSKTLLYLLEQQVHPMLNCFGHIHVSSGRSYAEGITWANAAICNDDLEPVNNPMVFDLAIPMTSGHLDNQDV